MNVIVSNVQQNALTDLDIDIIKSITGTYTANEIVEMFKNFFYNKMILDVTAIKNYEDLNNLQIIATGLDPEKIVFYLPENSKLCTADSISKIVTMGIYNFTTNLEGVKYLIRHSNTFQEVSHLQIQTQTPSEQVDTSQQLVNAKCKILGIKNITDDAGSTTLTYMLKKELANKYGNSVIAIEVDKGDFIAFNDKTMISVRGDQLKNTINNHKDNAKIIIIDLNNYSEDYICDQVFYLLEPSTIKLSKILRKNSSVLKKYKSKCVLLNKSLLNSKDVAEFENEANLKIFYNMPPLDERRKNGVINDFLIRIGLLDANSNKESGKVFGLFRK